MKKSLLMGLVLMITLLQGALAQSRGVSGRVIDRKTNEGLPGVTVLVKGTTNGASTNADGAFTIEAPQGATLIFSSVGYMSQERALGSDATVSVSLVADVKQLTEVVVTALGLTANRDQLGTAQATVQGTALVRSGETSVITALSGKTPGVLITRTSGDPGASANIQIRGASTITGNLQPLIVVDGIPIYNSSVGDAGIVSSNGGSSSNQTNGVVQASRLNDINPDDIASMEVLKGAAAGAIWGTRAANGVIVITTKKGANPDGRMSVSYRTSYGVDQINRTPSLQTTFGQGAGGLYNNTTSASWGDKISDRTGGVDAFITSPTAPGYQGYVTFPDGTRRYNIANGTAANPHGGRNTTDTYNQARAPFTNGYTWDNIASISGGDTRSNFYVSLGDTYQKGIAINHSDNERTTARVNVDRQLSDKFRVALNTSYIRTRSNRVQQGSNTSGIYLGGLRTSPDYDNSHYIGDYTDASGNIFLDRQVSYRNKIGRTTVSPTNTFGLTNAGYDNPLWTIDRVLNQTRVNRFLGSVELSYDVLPWLNFLNRTGVDTYTDQRSAYFPINATASVTGSLTQEVIQETQVNNDFIVRAHTNFGENLTVTGLVGYNLNARRSSQVGASASGFINPFSPPQLSNTPATNRSPFNLTLEQRTAALYGQLDLGFFNQLFLSGTVRGEQASTFGPKAKSVFVYPSGSLAWQFTKLGVFAENPVLSFGKLRVSYGTVGIQPNPYLTRTYYVPADANTLVDGWGTSLDASNYGGGFVRSTVKGNEFLRPELKKEFEGGLDLRFAQNRIGLNLTAYSNKTTDAILSVPVAASSGYTNTNANAATITNKGLEISMDGDVVKTGKFTWNLAPNFSLNRNKVTDLAGATSIFLTGFTGTSSRAVQGYPLGALWGTAFDVKEDGTYNTDANGFPKLADNGTERVIGNPNPQWRGGLNNTFTYRGLSLNVLVDHVHGTDVWNGTKGALYFFGTAGELAQETTISAAQAAKLIDYNGSTLASTHHANTDGSYTFRGKVQNFGSGDVILDEQWYRNGLGNGFTGGPATPFIEHVNYTRLREVTLNYNLRQDWLRNATKLSSIDLSVTGRNIYLWTNYTGVDPETNLTGVSNGRGLDYFNNPSTRSIIFSIKFTY
jgi:TonB-linked SusC/RagA family outer membrane protein